MEQARTHPVGTSEVPMTKRSDASNRAAWEHYWSREHAQPAYAAQGRLTAILNMHWDRIFGELAPNLRDLPCLDIAAGNGDLSARLTAYLQQHRTTPPAVIACDLSQDAARQLQSRNCDHAVRCDAARLPFANQCMDVVISQFGVEYAGPHALDECARVIAPGGTVALAMHHSGGALHQENTSILAAVEAFQACQLLPAFARFAANDRDIHIRNAFIQAVKGTEAVLHQHGPDIAAGSLLRLYREVATLHENLSRYDRDEVGVWCTRMSGSVESYAARTRWMIEAALSVESLQDAQNRFAEQGLTVVAVEPILDDGRPVAWSLIATRRH
ncbi:MAG: methyltransferase domain-containing protein [Burkholderiales bacterium]|nr:methyltransferase domain-containing protein [Burkholderiales bacterium]